MAAHTTSTPANQLKSTINQVSLTEQPRLHLGPAIFWSVDRSLASRKLATPAAALTAPLRPQLPQCSFLSSNPKQQSRYMRHWSRKVLLRSQCKTEDPLTQLLFQVLTSTLPAMQKQTAGLNAALCYLTRTRSQAYNLVGSLLAVRKGELLSENTGKYADCWHPSPRNQCPGVLVRPSRR